ncbi:class II aldolase/adducin family protein [Roseibium marinum]|uniref:Ribulose-5-phosphate 4-epimerase/fuculose-1-phosphate aldolase n=1 Tax=Roseibium marinum TaxID=281252 RepID=A0A2S3UJS3_9HYPH|nr:class II aldolase/adducin family protein [Roseibium marinum]POF27911.1 ribulose-5-phosphate 4-epimerase/fuculose-1-phosphate aldolase [Roseibium marinum]
MNEKLVEDLCELACAARVLAVNGHEDMTLGHVALRDPDGRGIWMKRRGLSLGEVRDQADFLLVDWDGKVLEGEGNRHGEWPIHTEVMLARPDIQASLHSHPEYATLLTASEAAFPRFTQDGLRLGSGGVPRFTDTADLLVDREQGRQLAGKLGDADIVFMKNHGTSIYAETIAKLALTGIFLERAARALIRAKSAGLELEVPAEGDAQKVIGSLEEAGFVADNWNYLLRDLRRREGPGMTGRADR